MPHLARHQGLHALYIGEIPRMGFIIGMTHGIASLGSFTANMAFSRHNISCKEAAYYTKYNYLSRFSFEPLHRGLSAEGGLDKMEDFK